MKKRTRIFLSVAVLLLVSGLLFAQGEKDKQASPSAAKAGTAKGEFVVVDPAITLTAHIHYGNVYVLDDNWRITKEIGKMTGVNLKGVASSMTTDSQEAFNLMIASHNIPDIVSGKNNDMMKYGQEGAFLPLNDLVEKYAPHYNAYLEKNPGVRSAITASDGNMYFIPMVYQPGASEGWFIRKDWLNKFGLSIPETVEDLHQALLTFVNNDANGNGLKDEVGYFNRGVEKRYIAPLLNLFGVNQFWHSDANGKVSQGLYSPQYKDAIKMVAQWYKEGLIDSEIFTRGMKSREILFSENNGALIHDWLPSTSSYNVKMSAVIPGFQLEGMLPPVDVNGNQWEASARDELKGLGWGIGYKNKYPIETMKYMDFYWTETGRTMMTYGIEGDTYTMVDGKPYYTDKILNDSGAINILMRKLGGQEEGIGYLHDASYENFAMDETGARTNDLYNESGVVGALYPKIGALGFTADELKTISNKFPTCETYMFEMMQKWVFDGSKIDATFDTYMANLKEMGMDEIVAAYQSAFDRAHGVK
jgi:putative aldouronate transport system substrate-binding protein